MAQRDEKDLRDDGESGPRDDGESGPRDDGESGPRDDDKSAPRNSGGNVVSSPEGFIPAHGGYEHLYSYQKALIVFDATVYFCRRFIDKKDRTFDQMIQAARSGKQNIVEGSQISGTSKELELKLTNVARASQEELLEDYRDFLRARGLEEWGKDHPYASRLRQLNRTPGANYETFRKGIEHPDPSICANIIIGLIKVTNYLLDQQIRSLEQAFLAQGGLREAMARARKTHRTKNQNGYNP